MGTLFGTQASTAPREWKSPVNAGDSRLHQLAPYIGKLRPAIARDLIERFTRPGDVILDCFAGSGTIPLEAVVLGRGIIAVDRSPYALTLTRAKVAPPESLDEALFRIERRLRRALSRPPYPLAAIPAWVQQFFHPDTLQDALRFADECIEQEDHFLLACLLGILHHQRPGFLSYPSSHLVPYLRDRKFPRAQFPDMYERRELGPRLVAKVRRTFKSSVMPKPQADVTIMQGDICSLELDGDVDAIITSPPYMNALDYERDNRLRIWFLDRSTADYSPEPTDRRTAFHELCMNFVQRALSRLRRQGRCVLVVGETVRRKRITTHPAELLLGHILNNDDSLALEVAIEDDIPDVRRTRRTASATKREIVLVIRKK